MKIKLNDTVLLKDKREGVIVEIYEQDKTYEIEFKLDNNEKYPEYETETIKYEDIEKIIN